MGSKFYDALKAIALVILPGVSALYFGLAQIWGLPKPEEVVGSIAVIDTFLGVVLKLNSTTYHNSDAAYDGTMNVVQKSDGGMTYDLSLNGDPTTLATQKSVSFKVAKPVDTRSV